MAKPRHVDLCSVSDVRLFWPVQVQAQIQFSSAGVMRSDGRLDRAANRCRLRLNRSGFGGRGGYARSALLLLLTCAIVGFATGTAYDGVGFDASQMRMRDEVKNHRQTSVLQLGETWADAAAAVIRAQTAGTGFSIFAYGRRRQPPFTIDSWCDARYAVRALHSRFQQKMSTWVMHDDAVQVSPAHRGEGLAGNAVWTHRPLDAVTLNLLWTTPYMFDFLLLPEEEVKEASRHCPGRPCQRLGMLLALAKTTIVLPKCLSDASSGDLSDWDPYTEVRQSMVDEAVRWQQLQVRLRLERVPGLNRPLVLFEVEKMVRFARHHFNQTDNRLNPRAYDVVFNRSRSWTPALKARLTTSRVLRGNQTGLPQVLDGGTTVVFDGRPYTRIERTIPLTRLQMVNLRLIIGLWPSFTTRYQLWEAYQSLPYFDDCPVTNVCFDGGELRWCDGDFVPSSKAMTIREVSSANRLRCSFFVMAAFFQCNGGVAGRVAQKRRVALAQKCVPATEAMRHSWVPPNRSGWDP